MCHVYDDRYIHVAPLLNDLSVTGHSFFRFPYHQFYSGLFVIISRKGHFQLIYIMFGGSGGMSLNEDVLNAEVGFMNGMSLPPPLLFFCPLTIHPHRSYAT